MSLTLYWRSSAQDFLRHGDFSLLIQPSWSPALDRRGVHRKRRERRPLPGMMLHVDGSDHQCFQDERRHELIVILDDATSEIYYAQQAGEESTATVMAGLRAVIKQKGLFCSLYSDRGPPA
jgi:hypothetical protein